MGGGRHGRAAPTTWILLILLALVFATHWISKARCFALTGDLVCRVETERKLVALTFDDGPTPEGTAATLAMLGEAGTKATFFLIGEQMARHPGLARQIAAAGHEVGNHSYAHERMMLRSVDFYRNEIARTEALLRAEGGAPSGLFRPPFGKKLIGVGRAAERSRHRIIMWDVEEPDRAASPRAYADHILTRVRPGSIILIHPMYRHNEQARNALPLILRGLKDRGYRGVTVSALLGAG